MSLLATQGTDSVGAINIKREGNADDAYIDFMTQANSGSMSERMRITSAGNVVINHTAAADGLTATATLSTVNFANQRNDLVIDTYHAGGEMSALWFRKSDSNTVGTKTETADDRNLGAIYWQGVDTGGNFDYGAFIEVKQVDDAGARCPTEMRIGTSDGTNIPLRMKIDEVGNIGIRGIETPQAHGSNWSIHLPDNYQIGFGDGANSRPDFGIMGDSSNLNFYCGEGSDDVDIMMNTNGELGIGTAPSASGVHIYADKAQSANLSAMSGHQLVLQTGSDTNDTASMGFYASGDGYVGACLTFERTGNAGTGDLSIKVKNSGNQSSGDEPSSVATFNKDGNAVFDGSIGSSNFSSGTTVSSDMDSLTKPGFYRIDNEDGINQPVNATHYSCIVTGRPPNVISQWAVHLTNGQTYTRCFNSYWSSWVRIDD